MANELQFHDAAKAAPVVQQSSEPVRKLDPHQRQLLAGHVTEIKRLGKQAVSSVIEIGGRLHACKFLVGYGNWEGWLEAEFGWSERTARYFISVYEMAKRRSANFAELGLPLSALYLLAAPSTPTEVIDEVIARAERGEVIRFTDVKATIEEAKAEAVGNTSPDFPALGKHAERLDPQAHKRPKKEKPTAAAQIESDDEQPAEFDFEKLKKHVADLAQHLEHLYARHLIGVENDLVWLAYNQKGCTQ